MKRLVVDGYGKTVSRHGNQIVVKEKGKVCLLYTSPSPRD